MEIDTKLGKSFKKKLAKQIEGWDLKVGILEDKRHYDPKTSPSGPPEPPKTYAGGSIRRTTRNSMSIFSTGEIFIQNMKLLGVDLLREPFKGSLASKNNEILKFTEAFLKLATKQKVSLKRVENLLQAVVRNPILRQDYGYNSRERAEEKGFNRLLFDTGQMFKAIKAKAKKRV